jgi:oligopeptide transport system ATP-binding protein
MRQADPLLQVEKLSVEFEHRAGFLRASSLRAVDGVSMRVAPGETVGLVGESGSGKSTLARALMRLIRPSAGRVSGRVRFLDQEWLTMPPAELRRRRRHLQLVFQDPLACLNPRMTIGDTMHEPLKIFRPELDFEARRLLVDAMLVKVGLEPRICARYPNQFSGGQCQRIGIARAMIADPAMLICDEPVSALDVSIQGQIVNLLSDMQRETGAAMIFISHNLGIVRHVSQRVYVIYRGRIVERADCETLFAAPRHPYTRALIDAIPQIPVRPRFDSAPPDVSDARSGSPGCAFADRCAHAAKICREQVPDLAEAGSNHWVACLRFREI